MVGEPPAPHVASTSSPIGNRGHLLGSSEAFTIKCRWRDEDKRVCGQWVTKETCAAHLASVHGIRGIPSDREILCRACCPPRIIKRESILRHFVEVHIGVKRKPTSGKGKKDRNHWAPSSHPGAGG
ncbi:hypothetical protein SCLCIDRAFT_1216385 [Scleroderma citrinum Foug A]|uniref:C2H2-type domain-containing protein n=1 Tax=Scleroderma citrinum Foug A TaxID=1036808 RepID=A0A0C2ZGS9_9AGAM|nr:hypothetical protein SCLCIDRAFT_1216385 [Scleroderma citrinum Foug A]